MSILPDRWTPDPQYGRERNARIAVMWALWDMADSARDLAQAWLLHITEHPVEDFAFLQEVSRAAPFYGETMPQRYVDVFLELHTMDEFRDWKHRQHEARASLKELMSVEQYLETLATACPCCHVECDDDQIELGPYESVSLTGNVNAVIRHNHCTVCGATWYDEYKLVGYRELRPRS
jgi:hypothetical protein